MRSLAVWIVLILALFTFIPTTAQDNDERLITAADAVGIRQLAVLEGHFEAVHGLAFSPDSELLASAGDDFTVRVWQVASTAQPYSRELHAGFARDVAFTQLDEQLLLASAGWDRLVVLSEVPADAPEDTEQITTLPAGNAVIDHVAFSPDGTQIAHTIGSGVVAVYDTDTQEPINRYEMPTLQGTALAFSPDGRYLAAASGFPSTAISVFDLDSDELQAAYTLDADSGTITGAVFLPVADDTPLTLVIVDDAGGIRLWQLAEEASVIGEGQLEDAWPLAVDVTPAGDLLAIGQLDGRVQLWDISEPTTPVVAAVLRGSGTGPEYAITFSPDGTLLATGGDDGMISLWGLPLD